MNQTTSGQTEGDHLEVTAETIDEGDLELLNELYSLFYQLGWKVGDYVVLEVGGAATSGIEQPDGYNERWSLQEGVTKFSKDAFLVIKNLDNNSVVSSLSKEQQAKQTDDELNYDTSGK